MTTIFLLHHLLSSPHCDDAIPLAHHLNNLSSFQAHFYLFLIHMELSIFRNPNLKFNFSYLFVWLRHLVFLYRSICLSHSIFIVPHAKQVSYFSTSALRRADHRWVWKLRARYICFWVWKPLRAEAERWLTMWCKCHHLWVLQSRSIHCFVSRHRRHRHCYCSHWSLAWVSAQSIRCHVDDAVAIQPRITQSWIFVALHECCVHDGFQHWENGRRFSHSTRC